MTILVGVYLGISIGFLIGIVVGNISGRASGRMKLILMLEDITNDIYPKNRPDLDPYTILFVLKAIQNRLMSDTEMGQKMKKKLMEEEQKYWKKVPKEIPNEK